MKEIKTVIKELYRSIYFCVEKFKVTQRGQLPINSIFWLFSIVALTIAIYISLKQYKSPLWYLFCAFLFSTGLIKVITFLPFYFVRIIKNIV